MLRAVRNVLAAVGVMVVTTTVSHAARHAQSAVAVGFGAGTAQFAPAGKTANAIFGIGSVDVGGTYYVGEVGWSFIAGALYGGGYYQIGSSGYQADFFSGMIGPGVLLAGKQWEMGFYSLALLGGQLRGKNTTSTTVNGVGFANSTIVTYSGTTGGMVRLVLRRRQRSPHDVTTGLGYAVDIGVLPLTKMLSDAVTANGNIADEGSTSTALTFSNILFTLGFFF